MVYNWDCKLVSCLVLQMDWRLALQLVHKLVERMVLQKVEGLRWECELVLQWVHLEQMMDEMTELQLGQLKGQ